MPKKKQKTILLWSDVRGDEALLRDDDNARYVFNEIKKGNYTAGSVSLHPINSAQKYSLYAAGHKGDTRYLYAEFFIEKTKETILYLVCDFIHNEYKRLSADPHLEKINNLLNDNIIQDKLAREKFDSNKAHREQTIKETLIHYNLKNNILVSNDSFIYLNDKQKVNRLQSQTIGCVVGCAGAGKTLSVIETTIKYALQYPEKDILFITETRKTVAKIKDLLSNSLSPSAMEKLTVTTYKDLAESNYFTTKEDFIEWFHKEFLQVKTKNKNFSQFLKNKKNIQKIYYELPITTEFDNCEDYVNHCDNNNTLFLEKQEKEFAYVVISAYQHFLMKKNTFTENTFLEWKVTYFINNKHHAKLITFIEKNKSVIYNEIINLTQNKKLENFTDKKNVELMFKLYNDYMTHLSEIKKIEIFFHHYHLNKTYDLMVLEEMQLISSRMALSLLKNAKNALLSFDPLQTVNNCFPRTKVFIDRFIYERINLDPYQFELFEPKEINSVKETLAKKTLNKNKICVERLSDDILSYKLSSMGNKTGKINLLDITQDKNITLETLLIKHRKAIIQKIMADKNIKELNVKDYYTYLKESERCPEIIINILNEKIFQTAIYSGGMPSYALPIQLSKNTLRTIKGEAEWLEWDEQTIKDEAKQITLHYLNNPSVAVMIADNTFYEEANELFTSTFENPNTKEIEKISLIILPPDGVIGQDIDTVIVYDHKHPESEEMKDFQEISKKFTENFAKNAKANYQGIKSFCAEEQLKAIYFYQEIEKISRTARKIIYIGQANLNEITKRDRKLYSEYPLAKKKSVDVTIEDINTLEKNREKNLAQFIQAAKDHHETYAKQIWIKQLGLSENDFHDAYKKHQEIKKFAVSVEATAIDLPKKKTLKVSKAAKELALCFINNNLTSIKQFLKKNTNFDINQFLNKDGKTALHLAIDSGNESIIDYLLKQNNINVNINDLEGNSPFYYAIKNKQEKIIQYFVVKKDINLETCIEMALKLENIDMISEMFDSVDEQNLFFIAYPHYKDKILKSLFKSYYTNLDLHKTNHDALRFILTNDDNHVLDLNQPVNQDGNTLLHEAVRTQDHELVKILTQQNIDICIQNFKGDTALDFVAHKKSTQDITECDIKNINSIVKSVINYAFEKKIRLHDFISNMNDIGLSVILVFHKPYLDRLTLEELIADLKYFADIFFVAIICQQDTIVNLLLDKGLDIHVLDKNGNAFFTHALFSNNIYSIQKLMARGFDPKRHVTLNSNAVDLLLVEFTVLCKKETYDENSERNNILFLEIIHELNIYFEKAKNISANDIDEGFIKECYVAIDKKLSTTLPDYIHAVILEILKTFTILGITLDNHYKELLEQGYDYSIIKAFKIKYNPHDFIFKEKHALSEAFTNKKFSFYNTEVNQEQIKIKKTPIDNKNTSAENHDALLIADNNDKKITLNNTPLNTHSMFASSDKKNTNLLNQPPSYTN